MRIVTVLCLLAAVAVSAAGVTIRESSSEGMVVSFDAAVPRFGTVLMRGVLYSTVSMDGSESLAEAGFPRLPVYRTWIEIPVGATVEVAVTELRVEYLPGTGLPVEPAVLSAAKSDSRDSFILEPAPEV